MASPTIHTLTSFGGADLIVSFSNQVIGELQAISWGIERECAPIFTLGSADARSYSRGKRAIAGSMQFAMFDQDSVVNALQRVWDKIAPPAMFTAAGNLAQRQSEDFSTVLNLINWNKKSSEQTNISENAEAYGFSGTSAIKPGLVEGSNGAPIINNGEITGWNKGDSIHVPAGFSPIRGSNVLYADSLPPFDVTMTFANEFGQTAFQKIYDVNILNESSGVSVDTIVTERKFTYVARRISPLIKGIYSREEGGLMKGMSPTGA